MKSEIITLKKAFSRFPKLMISNDNTEVILIWDENNTDNMSRYVGVVIQSTPNSFHEVGFYSDSWCKESFKDFHGQIILTEE